MKMRTLCSLHSLTLIDQKTFNPYNVHKAMRNAIPMQIISIFDFYYPAIDEFICAGFGQYGYTRRRYHNGNVVWLYHDNNKEVNEPGLSEKLEAEYQRIKHVQCT